MPSNDVEFLNQLCQQLYDDKTWERFRFCKLIRLCLSGHKNIDAIKNDAWAKLLRDAVNEMFCSRLFGEFRDEAFNLAGQMTLTFGNVDWIKCEATWNQNNSEFLILLLQLVSIEVRVVLPRLLEEKPPHWVNPEFGSTFILMEKLLLAFINNVNNDDEIALKTQDLLKINAAQIISHY
ncbi:hypothetical protein TYRP_002215 [Tyrophagus putrescentiae]|nr:hypothetical protein TYRP_002215 [Tyrophagus putrescentiae]